MACQEQALFAGCSYTFSPARGGAGGMRAGATALERSHAPAIALQPLAAWAQMHIFGAPGRTAPGNTPRRGNFCAHTRAQPRAPIYSTAFANTPTACTCRARAGHLGWPPVQQRFQSNTPRPRGAPSVHPPGAHITVMKYRAGGQQARRCTAQGAPRSPVMLERRHARSSML